MNVAFEKLNFSTQQEEVCILPSHVVEAVRKSEEQIKNGQFYTHKEVMKSVRDRKVGKISS